MRNLISILFIALSLCCGSAIADVMHPKVNLMAIKAIKHDEKRGDELYMTITVYPSKGRPRHYNFPKEPLHWPSKHIDKLQPTQIFDQKLDKGESVMVIFALIERDVPPWNTDDLVGEVKLQLKNDESGLSKRWSILTRGASGEIKSTGDNPNLQVAELLGDDGHHYEVKLNLIEE